MKKTVVVSAVIILLLAVASWAWAEEINELAPETKGAPADKKELAVVDGNDLVICTESLRVPKPPKGVPDDIGLALVRGTIPKYAAIDDLKTRLLFSWPLKEKVGRTYRLVSYQQGWWFQEPGSDSLIRKSSFPFTGLIVFFSFIFPPLAVLFVNLGQKKRREMLLLYLVISLCSIVASNLSFIIGGDGGLTAGVITGMVTGAITGWLAAGFGGAFTAYLFSTFAALFSNRLTVERIGGMTDWLRTNHYLLFIAICCLLSFLLAEAIKKIAFDRKVRKFMAA